MSKSLAVAARAPRIRQASKPAKVPHRKACEPKLPTVRQNHSDTMFFKLSDDHGHMSLKQFNVPAKAVMSWHFRDAPFNLQTLDMGGAPDFITVVPNCMRFSHMPAHPMAIYELKDGYIVFE